MNSPKAATMPACCTQVFRARGIYANGSGPRSSSKAANNMVDLLDHNPAGSKTRLRACKLFLSPRASLRALGFWDRHLLLDMRARFRHRQAGAVPTPQRLLAGQVTPPRMRLAVGHDPQEQVLQAGRWVAHKLDLASVPLDDFPKVLAQRIVQLHPAGSQLQAVHVCPPDRDG